MKIYETETKAYQESRLFKILLLLIIDTQNSPTTSFFRENHMSHCYKESNRLSIMEEYIKGEKCNT